MDCPRCHEALLAKYAGDVEIDVCTGCAGWWLDRGELGKLLARGHRMGSAPADLGGSPPGMPEPINPGAETRKPDRPPRVGFSESPRPSFDDTKPRCPRDGAVLQEIGVGGELVVTVDRCPQCGGFWLDTGELDHAVDFLRARIGDRLPADVELKLDKRSLTETPGSTDQRPQVPMTKKRKKKTGFFDAEDLLEGLGQITLIGIVAGLIGELFD